MRSHPTLKNEALQVLEPVFVKRHGKVREAAGLSVRVGHETLLQMSVVISLTN